MANEEQQKNQNGRSVLVISEDNFNKVIDLSGNIQDAITYTTDGAKLVEKHNFSWGLLHSKTTVPFSLDHMAQVKNMKVYFVNPETGRVFYGNQYRGVSNIGTTADKVGKLGDRLGKITNGAEIFVAIKNDDPKALSQKTSEIVLEKGGETIGLALAGKCTNLAIKRVQPKRVAVAGLACYAAAVYSLKGGGKALGTVVGKTETGEELASVVIKTLQDLDKKEAEAERKRREREYKKNPMLEWHTLGAD
ncbi:hypothetical protein [Acinetobacter larvae]|uniref:Uncharacterized protein n=1 Tax=Acinetobacter larvae TaxID=1789224 RepID=A0A1B2LYM3_9GAMM|nr:hypothetical protein [Acinetobacter larvae]AOA58026.1 hypothetical protein BFG52_06445 [Acinetobacter larvae]